MPSYPVERVHACECEHGLHQGKNAETLAAAFQKVLGCMGDPELPVRVQAALAINHFVEHDCANVSSDRK